MFEEYERRKKRQISTMRSLLDYGMGLLILIAGIFFFFREKFNLAINERFAPDAIDKIFGGVCIVYGIWRIYRGYRKNYFR
jgi:cytochrome c biogenesis protein CcdA